MKFKDEKMAFIKSRIFPGILIAVLALTQIAGEPNMLSASGTDWLAASDVGQGDYFGRSVSISGDTIVVGAYGSYAGGAVYIFVRNGSAWLEQAKLRPHDGDAEDCFGYSVSISGNTILVGAYQSNQDTGAAYIFERNGSGYWIEQAKLAASDGMAGDRFGFDVSISGDTALIGGYQSTKEKGAAYIFERTGSSWVQKTKLAASDGLPGDGFGSSVCISGDTAMVGAYHSDQDTGAAYIFERNVSTWAQQAKLTASDGVTGDWFGADVCLSGDTALIGAYHSDQDTGAAYIFVRSGSTWTQEAQLKPSGLAVGDFFGYSVSISGDTALVGAYHTNQNTGDAYVFMRGESGWNQSDGFTPVDSLMPNEWFGYSVSVNEGTIVVGAPRKNERGAVYLDAKPDSTLSGELNTLILPVNTAAATSITTTSATLNGTLASIGGTDTVNVYFEYGSIMSLFRDRAAPFFYYGNRTPVQAMNETGTFSADIQGLTAGTTYHFRARVDSDAIGVSFGPDMMFTTLPAAQEPGANLSIPPSPQSPPETPFNTWLRNYHRFIIASLVIATGMSIIFLDVKDKTRRRPISLPTASRAGRPGYDISLKKLEKLIELRTQGAISDQEYAIRKAEILKEMRISRR